jgi:hypothetical protein
MRYPKRVRSASASPAFACIASAYARAQRASASRRRSPRTAGSASTRCASSCDLPSCLCRRSMSARMTWIFRRLRFASMLAASTTAKCSSVFRASSSRPSWIRNPGLKLAAWLRSRCAGGKRCPKDPDGPVDLFERQGFVSRFVADARQVQPVDGDVRMIAAGNGGVDFETALRHIEGARLVPQAPIHEARLAGTDPTRGSRSPKFRLSRGSARSYTSLAS